MDCLLFGGTTSVGKTETIYELADRLIKQKNFTIIAADFTPLSRLPTRPVGSPAPDFKAILKGKNKQGQDIIIILNSPTDTKKLIDTFESFMTTQKLAYDILISSVRDTSFSVRGYFFTKMAIHSQKSVLEFPLAKIGKRGDPLKFAKRLSWYRKYVDTMVDHILSLPPYNL